MVGAFVEIRGIRGEGAAPTGICAAPKNTCACQQIPARSNCCSEVLGVGWSGASPRMASAGAQGLSWSGASPRMAPAGAQGLSWSGASPRMAPAYWL